EVGIQSIAACRVERRVGGGKGLALEFVQQIGNRLTGGNRDVDGGHTAIQAVRNSTIAGDVTAHGLRDGKYGAVVLCVGDLQAGIDVALDRRKVILGFIEELQGGHC